MVDQPLNPVREPKKYSFQGPFGGILHRICCPIRNKHLVKRTKSSLMISMKTLSLMDETIAL